jgi:sugar/nucleoside kinase (ribokinase family)
MEYLAKFGPLVVVKQGDRGASLFVNNQTIQVGSISVDVVDTVGAGDTFDAGFLYGYLQHGNQWSFDKILKFACTCGALSTRSQGGTDSQPFFNEVNSYMYEEDNSARDTK